MSTQTTNYKLNKPAYTDYASIGTINQNMDIIDDVLKQIELESVIIPTAGGTPTALTLTLPPLKNGYIKTFIALANNDGSPTTINGVPLYKPGTTTAPNLIGGKAYTVWYDSVTPSFFIKASAEGNAPQNHVLAGDIYSNDTDTGLTGTMPNNGAINITPGATAKTIPLGYTSGGTVAGDSNLIAGNIKSGVSIFGVTGKSSIVDTTDGSAIASQILSGSTGYINGAKVTGTMANNGAVTITPGATAKTIPVGYHNGSGTVATDSNLVTGNVKSGVTIFGVSGKSSVVETSDGTATASQILSGATAYVNGSKITGNIASKGATTYTPGTANQTISAGQYLSGIQTISGDPDLIASNIVSTANIFGVQGSATISSLGGKPYSTGSCTIQFLVVTAGNTNTAGNQKKLVISVSGLSFTPKIVQVYTSQTWFYFNAMYSNPDPNVSHFGLMDSTKGYTFFNATLTSGGFSVDSIYGDYDIVSDTRVPLPWIGTGTYIAIG